MQPIIAGPPPPPSYNTSWKLISQGAEARVWIVPNFLTSNKEENNLTSTVICKERFPKSYRHPILDENLTKSRTKAEAKNLTKCRRGGVSVPIVFGIHLGKKKDSENPSSVASACIFLEYVKGCSVRSFLNVHVTIKDVEPLTKKSKTSSGETTTHEKTKIVTRLDEFAKKMSHAIGCAIGKMHNASVVHGDLTTSNIILRNPPDEDESIDDWSPDIVLIDFGLSATSNSTKNRSSYEDRAVDLYVLERAFATTHVGSEVLVQEVLRGYKATSHSSDSVFQRLSQVRARGRKRECFG
jgi:TP53 regulating kinase-like protein